MRAGDLKDARRLALEIASKLQEDDGDSLCMSDVEDLAEAADLLVAIFSEKIEAMMR